MWNAISPGFELMSLCPIPATMPITPRAPPVLEIWGMWSTLPSTLLSDPLWPGVVVPVFYSLHLISEIVEARRNESWTPNDFCSLVNRTLLVSLIHLSFTIPNEYLSPHTPSTKREKESQSWNLWYTRVIWKVHCLTKILSWNVTKWGLFFDSSPCSPHTFSVSIVVLGFCWSKKSLKVDITSSYELFSSSLYIFNIY